MAKKKNKNRPIWERLYDYQTRLQGVANSLSVQLAELIAQTDASVKDVIVDELPRGNKTNIRREFTRYERIMQKVEKVRAASYVPAHDIIMSTAMDVISSASAESVKEIAAAIKDSRRQTRERLFSKELSPEQQKQILDYQPVDGRTISDWFSNWKRDDLERISSAVQRASVEQMTVADVSRLIRGTRENNYNDGILATSQASAVRLSRTLINGVSNNSRVETFKENMDVLDGIRFVGTLDGKTCPYCAALDGTIWRGEDSVNARRPPIHPNCRCTLIPYIEMKDEDGNVVDLEGDRPAANADFDKLAQDAYNAQAREKGLERRWDDLAPSTRLKYYYQAQKDYEKETGKPAFRQVNGAMTFAEYFKQQGAEFQRSWLGAKRYELYAGGKLTEKQLFTPSITYTVPSSDLFSL